MESSEIPATDSGYPTPREDLPLSSRSESPPFSPIALPLTSTPLRGKNHHPIRDPLGPRSSSLSDELSTIDEAETSGVVMQGVRTMLKLAKDAKATSRVNVALRHENGTLRDENESLRDENCSLREESRRMELENASLRYDHEENMPPPIVPKLNLIAEDEKPSKLENLFLSEDIKKELLSFIKNDQEQTVLEQKLEHMVPPKVFSATVQVNAEQMDADVQTDSDDQVNIINSDWQIKVDKLHSEIEITEKKNTDLKDRLFDYEQMKAKFEEDQEKLRSDLEKKLKASQEQVTRYEKKMNELEARLSKKRTELEEATAENRRFVDDRETLEFETEELKDRILSTEKNLNDARDKVAQLEAEINAFQEKLEEEEVSKLALRQELEDVKKEFAKEVERLESIVDEAVAKEEEARVQLGEVKAEMNMMVKENEYLTAAQQVLLDSEMNLKTEATVMTATVRNLEHNLQLVQRDLSDEKKRSKEAASDLLELGLTNQQLEDEKRDSEELLRELKKGKLEIDYLRQQVHITSQDSEKTLHLRQQLQQNQHLVEELQGKLTDAQKKEKKLIARHEENIRLIAARDTELDRLKQEVSAQNEHIEIFTVNQNQSEKIKEDLQKALEALDHEFSDFKTHANMQYRDEIGQRDQKIAYLHERLIQLETYPGHSISVSKRNAEAQTEEPKGTVAPTSSEDVSPEVTLVSEHQQSVEQNIRTLIEKMERYVRGRSIGSLPISYQDEPGRHLNCAETFRQIVVILRFLLDAPEALGQKTDEFWNDQVQRAEYQKKATAVMLKKATRQALEDFQRLEEEYKLKTQKLEKQLREVQQKSNQRLYIADEFRAQYELELKNNEEQLAVNRELTQAREQERLDWEESNRDLRVRLEKAQHAEQKYARDRLKRSDVHDETIEEMRIGFQKNEKELKYRLKMTEAELATEKKRIEYDRGSMSKMRKDFDVVAEKCHYLKKRNNERQKILNDMKALFLKCQQSADPNQTMFCMSKMQEKLNDSNQIDLSDDSSSDKEEEPIIRRAFGELNQQN